MTERKVINRLQRYQPTTAQAVLDYCELPLQYIGGGAFRDTYHVIGTNVVIKIPRLGAMRRRNIKHATDEFVIWERMKGARKGFGDLKKYLPKLIYFNSVTGVIVMEKYEKVKRCAETNRIINELEEEITDVLDTNEADIHYGNIGQDKDGNIKLIDMGLFITGRVPHGAY